MASNADIDRVVRDMREKLLRPSPAGALEKIEDQLDLLTCQNALAIELLKEIAKRLPEPKG